MAFGQQKPNFSGRWVVVLPAEAAGTEQAVRHEGDTLTLSHGAEGPDHRFVYKLDGTEHRNVLKSHGEDLVTISRASWKGDQLTITSTTTYPDGRKLDQFQVLSLDSQGQLVISVTETMAGKLPMTTKVVLKKAGSNLRP